MKTANLKTKKGLIEIELILQNNKITHLTITGDFFFYPEEALEEVEKKLVGLPAEPDQLKKQLELIYQEKNIITPGITIDDWIAVILKAINKK